jgi:agmatinase
VLYGSTGNAPQEIISASRSVERYDEEFQKEIYKIGIHTLNPISEKDAVCSASRKMLHAGKFVVALGGEHSITSPLVKAHLEKWPSMAVLQIDAHADLNIEQCPVVSVGIGEEVQTLQKSKSKIFFPNDIENDPEWFVKVVDELPEHVYFTIHIDNSSSWESLINLTRELTHRRNVVGFDIVELTPQVPAIFCAKLLYKILGYVFR